MADQTNAEVSDERLPVDTAEAILTLLGIGYQPSREPGADRRRDGVVALLNRRSVTSQASEGAEDASEAILHLLVEKLDGFSVELVSKKTGESRLGFSVGSHRSVAISEIIALVAPVSKRVERLETELAEAKRQWHNYEAAARDQLAKAAKAETALTEARAELKAAFYEGRASYHRVGGGNGEFAWEHSDTKSKTDGGRS